MKFTLSWLKRHLDTDASLEKIADTLTAVGLEVEEIQDRSKEFAPFTVATIESAEQHPDADRLKVCKVKTLDGTHQVVCGASNARSGMKGIFAPEGSYVPGIDLTLKKTKIRGVESCGMMVSEREMCLSDEHEGIIEVDESFEIGTPMAAIFGLDDPVIEIALTPNRADCAGVRGIARDLAAAGLGTLKKQNETPVDGSFPSPVSVSIDDQEGCPLFIGRTIKGVKNGPSPQWFQDLLKAVGLRPISALVDITNFMSMDQARPLHVYDIGKLQGNIVVRAAKTGEAFEALNDKSYTTEGGEIAICDDRGLIGLGGVVGGVSTGCDENTKDVFVEAAYFDPQKIARAGRDLQVQSDARYRFERGVDPVFTATGMEIATRLIMEFCGGKPSQTVQAGDVPDWERTIQYDPAYCQKLIGVDIQEDRQIDILQSLGFACKKSGTSYQVMPPPWRGDIQGKADLTEEIIRIHGFDQIPAVSVRTADGNVKDPETLNMNRSRRIRTALTARGFQEAVTWSFMNTDLAAAFGGTNDPNLKIKNPISSEMDRMRSSILPNLIEAAGRNQDHSYADVALCEIGPVFQNSEPEGQHIVAAGIRAGHYGPRHWADKDTARPIDLFDAKADAFAALESCGAPSSGAQITREAPDHYHPGRSGTIRLGKTILAQFGEIHPSILERMGIKTPVAGFEVYLDAMPQSRKSGTAKKYLALEPLQPVHRDFAFIVDQDTTAEAVIRVVKAADKKLITAVDIFDVYTGKGVEDDKKSVALSVTLQPQDKTLTDQDLEALSNKITTLVADKTGGILRG